MRYIKAIRAMGMLAMMVATVAAEPLQKRPTRQVDMAGYTVISDASDKAIADWVQDFDRIRQAGQQITGVKDDELLPLTILLFDRQADLLRVLPGSLQLNSVIAVGLSQQPVIALDAESRGEIKEVNTRFAVLTWLMGSSGLNYDHWVMQGLLDLFGTASLREDSIVIGKSFRNMKTYLHSALQQYHRIPFDPGSSSLPPAVDWLAMHYLVIGEPGWQGLAAVTQYQRRVTLGEPRTLAFKNVFGIDPNQASAAMEKYYRGGKIKASRLAWRQPPKLDHVQVQAAEAGLRELSLARLILQLSFADYDRARRLNDVALAARPDDVRVQENLALYGVRTRQPQLATAALNRAMAMGTRNQAIRLQWCQNTIDDGFRQSEAFIIPADRAVAVADELHRLLEGNSNRVVVHSFLAEIIPSMAQAREEDRAMMESGLRATGGRSVLLRVGLAAWQWRNGQRDAALQQLRALLEQGDMGKQTEYYARWLVAQLVAEGLADQVDASMAANDFDQARRLLSGFAPAIKPYPALKQRIEVQNFVTGYEELLAKAEQAASGGERQQAQLLLGTLPVSKLPEALRARAETLAAKLHESANPGAEAKK